MSQTMKFTASRRGGRLLTFAAVPSLNWPRDLYADDVIQTDMMDDDFPLPHGFQTVSGAQDMRASAGGR